MTWTVGIVGTGPAGLATALALEASTAPGTVSITLLDRNATDTDYPGVEYGIQNRACRALDRLGLKEAALAKGHPAERMVFHVVKDGRGRDQVAVPVDPHNTYDVLRQEFLEGLTALLRRTEILRQHEVVQYSSLPEGRVRLTFADGEGAAPAPRAFDLVIAAEGVNSVARKQYFPDAPSVDQGFSSIYLPVEADPADPRVPEAFLRVANDTTVQFTLGSFSTNVWFPQGRHRLVFGLCFDAPTGRRLWVEHGLDPDTPWREVAPKTKKAIAQAVARDTPVHDGFMAEALELVPDWNSPRVYQWVMRDSDVLDEPFAPDCNLLLLGDSCRAFLPTIGMGASLAIEDAEHLGTRLGAYLEESRDRPLAELDLRGAVFRPFAEARRATWHDLIGRARAAAENFRGQGERTRFDVAPYVPTTLGSKVVGAAEAVLSAVRR